MKSREQFNSRFTVYSRDVNTLKQMSDADREIEFLCEDILVEREQLHMDIFLLTAELSIWAPHLVPFGEQILANLRNHIVTVHTIAPAIINDIEIDVPDLPRSDGHVDMVFRMPAYPTTHSLPYPGYPTQPGYPAYPTTPLGVANPQ